MSSAPDAATRLTVLLSVVGQLLAGVGMLALWVFLALSFSRYLAHPLRPLAPWNVLVAQKLQRGRRQIQGSERYRDDEIAQLRRLAEYDLAGRRVNWMGSFWGIAFFGGIAMTPHDPRFSPISDTALAEVVRVFAVVMVLFFVGLGVGLAVESRRISRAADAFLRRTQPVTWPADSCR